MSYSFSVRAANKDDLRAAIASQFDTVVQNQPIHAKDRDQAQTAANSLIDLASDEVAGHDITASIHGSCHYDGEDKTGLRSVNVGITIAFSVKPQE